jgi:hypothetical protein
MLKELKELKSELIEKGINPYFYAIDELPMYEGFCIYDARSYIEVFYYERGNRNNTMYFKDVTEAIKYFKNLSFIREAD